MKRQKVTNICDLQMSVSGAGLGREEGAERERERERERAAQNEYGSSVCTTSGT